MPARSARVSVLTVLMLLEKTPAASPYSVALARAITCGGRGGGRERGEERGEDRWWVHGVAGETVVAHGRYRKVVCHERKVVERSWSSTNTPEKPHTAQGVDTSVQDGVCIWSGGANNITPRESVSRPLPAGFLVVHLAPCGARGWL